MPNNNICAQLAQAIHQLTAQITAFRKAHPHEGTPPELQDLIDELADAENGFQTKCGPPRPLSFLPSNLDFGIVLPRTTGPSLVVDPSIPPPRVSFNGGIEIDSAPADATVNASITGDTTHFQVRDIIVIDTFVDEVGNVSREVVVQAAGDVPVEVKERQLLLVRVQYSALDSEGTFRGTCVIQSDAWETISVPLSITLGGIETDFPSPIVVTQGQDSEVPVVVRSLGGPKVSVTYSISSSQLDSGLSIVGAPIQVSPHETKPATIVFRVDPEAPLGIQTVAIDQFAPQHTSELVQVLVVQASVLVSLSQPAALQVRPGQIGTILINIAAQGASVNVLLESENAPNGFRLTSADRNVPAQSERTVNLEFSIDSSAPMVTDSPLFIKWSASDGEHSGRLTMIVTIVSDAVGVTAEDFGFANLAAGIGNKPLLLITWQLPAPSPKLAHGNDYYDQLVFNFLNTPSVNGYYLENSRGNFVWTRAGIIGPVLLDANEAATLNAKQSHGKIGIDSGAGVAYLLQLTAAKTGYNFAQWDTNGDGVVDNTELFIMIIGNAGNLFGGNRPIGADSSGQSIPVQNVTLRGQVAGLDHQTSLTTFAHESSHSLGTVDLYGPNQDLNEGLTLMSGTFESSADGRRTFHLDPWHKMRLGWLRPRIFALGSGGVATVTTAQRQSALTPVILYDPARGTSEYFIVEFRNRNPSNGGGSYDANIPKANGLAVWHVVPGSNPPAFHEGAPELSKGGNSLWTGRTPPLRWNDGTLSSTRLNLRSIAPDGSEMVFEWTD